jgi:hypothetical protein
MKTMLLLLAGCLAIPAANSKSDRTIDVPAAYGRLKTLAGEWEAKTAEGKDRLNYELIAGGTSLVERETSDSRPTMMTVYNVDAHRLLLTHFCMAGNQPRMQASAFDPATGELEFQFLDATNLPSPNKGHMHSVKMRFVDNDHLMTEWQFYENGKAKFKEAQQYTRVR